MKRNRVRITTAVVLGLLLAFFLIPLPINRVRETGLVQIQEQYIFQVTVPDPGGFLMEQYVHDGDRVVAGQDLASFVNHKLASRYAQLDEQVNFLRNQRNAIQAQMSAAPQDPTIQAKYREDLAQVEGKLAPTENQRQTEQRILNELKTLKAKHGGVVMSSPKTDELFMFWDKEETKPFCRIGDFSKMRVTVPVSSTEYREIKDNLERQRKDGASDHLEASILLANRSDHIYKGRVTTLPVMHETNVPVGLTSRGGGPVAVRPSQNPNENEPVAQTYLIQVEIMDGDASFCPGIQAKVKIYLRWRSGAWWVGQKLASMLDWGLW